MGYLLHSFQKLLKSHDVEVRRSELLGTEKAAHQFMDLPLFGHAFVLIPSYLSQRITLTILFLCFLFSFFLFCHDEAFNLVGSSLGGFGGWHHFHVYYF